MDGAPAMAIVSKPAVRCEKEACPIREGCLDIDRPAHCPLWRLYRSGLEVRRPDKTLGQENAERAWRMGGRSIVRDDWREMRKRLKQAAMDCDEVYVHGVGKVRLPDVER